MNVEEIYRLFSEIHEIWTHRSTQSTGTQRSVYPFRICDNQYSQGVCTLRDEELMVQRVLKTILGAVSWEEIEAVMMELFSSIEISQINQTSSEYLVQKALTIMKECYSDGITWKKQPEDFMLQSNIWEHN